MMENQPRMKENMKRPAGPDFSRDPRMDPRRGMIGDPRDPRNRPFLKNRPRVRHGSRRGEDQTRGGQ